ncbi:SpoIIE family protein phosphatase [Nibricoccus sp. IMCC34717]|uniref:SpoIIE family protein phosphatase n=1 Tax=Nibricoccus sp. IMCC34717 TaxID=3034021 RepID=UPI0038516E4F
MTSAEVTLCQSHELLRGLDQPGLEQLLEGCEILALPAGQVLLHTGQKNSHLYFLLQGELAVHLGQDDSGHAIRLKPGEIVGEMSVIEEKPVGARVVTSADSTVLAMPEEVYWRGYCTQPALVRPLLRSLIARMRRTNATLQEAFERQIRFEMMQRELESAARIQLSILPSTLQLVGTAGITLHPHFKPARVVGGDFYDVIPVSPNTLALVVGDVSGKGMPAALFMIRVVTALRMLLGRGLPPDRVLPELNAQLCDANEELMFVTLAVVLLNTTTGEAHYLNGGHNPIIHGSVNSGFATWEPPAGSMLGVNAAARFGLSSRTLARGDVLVLYTDGVTEAENTHHDQFGLGRTLDALAEVGPAHGASGLASQLCLRLDAFVGDAAQSDDITLLTAALA